MKQNWIVLILALNAPSITLTYAQSNLNNPQYSSTSPRSNFSLAVGYSENDFRYIDTNNAYTYDFQVSFPVMMLSWKNNNFRIGYGQQSTGKILAVPSLTMFDVSLSSGWNINLFKKLFGINFGTFLPIRTHLRYRNLTSDTDNLVIEIPDLQLLSTEIGLGIGLKFRPTNRSKLNVLYSLVSSVGVLSNLKQSSSENLRLSRSTDIDFQIRLERIIFNKIGLTIGYSFLSQRWTDEGSTSSKDIRKSIANPGDIPKRRGQGIFRIGITL